MAAQKRFLGLGFTFSAQDNGLEKKLMRINSYMDSISKSMGKINGKTFDVGAGGVGSSVSGGPKAQAQQVKQKQSFVKQKDTFSYLKDSISMMSKESSGWLEETIKLSGLPKKYVMKEFEDLEVFLDGHKSLTDSTKIKVLGNLTKMRDAYKDHNDMMKNSSKYIGDYLKDNKNAFQGLAESFGISISHMFPPQIKAMFAVMKSATRPVFDAFKGAGRKVFSKSEKPDAMKDMYRSLYTKKMNVPFGGFGDEGSSVSKEVVSAVRDVERGIKVSNELGIKDSEHLNLLAEISLKLGETYSSKYNVIQLLKTLVEKTAAGGEGKKKGGIWETLKKWGSSLAGLVGLTALWKGLKKIPFSKMGTMFSGLFNFKGMKGLGSIFGKGFKLGGLTGSIGNVIKSLARFALAGAAVVGLAKGIWEARDKIVEFGKALYEMFAVKIQNIVLSLKIAGLGLLNAWDWLVDSTKGVISALADLPIIGDVIKGISGVFDFFKEGIASAVDYLQNAFPNVFLFIKEVIVKTFTDFLALLLKPVELIMTAIKGTSMISKFIFGGAAELGTAGAKSVTAQDMQSQSSLKSTYESMAAERFAKTSDSSKAALSSLKQQEKGNDLSEKQIEALEYQNKLLEQIAAGKKGSVDVNIKTKFNSKMFNMEVEKGQMEEFRSSGVSTPPMSP